ncbi:MAG: Regulator of RpoS [Verrucomicrobiae bacterium]|nr:Regulator of RpoS [Verrucomicrobiae bacterium]
MDTVLQQVSAASSPAKLECFHVLVIDDNEIDREIIIHHLGKAWPFEREMATDTAANGHEALELMRTKRFALIVLDWKLPGLGGGDVLRVMRKTGIRIPVIVMSGLHRDQITEKLDALGAAFLNKDDMSADNFRTAIATSLQLLGVKRPLTAAAV